MSLTDYFERVTGEEFNFSDLSFKDVAAVGGTMFLNNKLGLDEGILSGTKKPPVGFQGEIPKYTKVRERVTQPSAPTQGKRLGIMTSQDITKGGPGMTKEDPAGSDERIPFTQADANYSRFQGDRYDRGYERRPGQYGRRYFSDSIFAKKEKSDAPSVEEARKTAKRQALELEGKSPEEIDQIMGEVSETNNDMAVGGRVPKYAHGGIAGAHKGYYLGGKTDGMADQVPARIDGKQEARLSDGEFVIPADVVSHLGNGNSDAGAQQLHSMMDNVRTARTGNPEQGKQINPQQFMPKMAQGGLAQYAGGGNVNAVQGENSRFKNQPYTTNFDGTGTGTGTNTGVEQEQMPEDQTPGPGQVLGQNESLAAWAGEYVTDMLGKGQAEAEEGYQAYFGPLTAGTSMLQDQAFTGISALNNPLSSQSVTNQMGTFTPDQADAFMNPYTQNVIDRTAADMRRQDQIGSLQDRTAMTQAGAFGGSRDALLRAERASNLSRNIGDMAAEQRALNYTQAMDRAKAAKEMANQYGFDVLESQAAAGQVQRDIASEGIAADYAQFREERDYDKKMVQYLQSLLQGLPIEASETIYSEPNELQNYFSTVGGLEALLGMFSGGNEEASEDDGASQVIDENQAAANATTA